MGKNTGTFLLLFSFSLLSFSARAAETVRCPCIADTWLSSANAQERETNSGKAERIKLKIFQEFGLIDFDVSALKGKTIESATLYVAPAGGERYAPERGSDLRWFTLSTVSSPWVEGKGTQYSLDAEGHGATYSEASYKTRPWAFPGSKIFDVAFGNGKTLRCDADGGHPKDGWFAIPVDPALVRAMVCNASHGWMIMDGSTGVDRNSYIASRENKKKAPYLVVTVGASDAAPPPPVSNIQFKPSLPDASATHGAGVLSFDAPADAFTFNITLNGEPLPRWQTPFAAGTKHSVMLEFLPADADLKFEIRSVDAVGNISEPATGTGRSSPKAEVPRLPQLTVNAKSDAPDISAGPVKVWAYPETSKLDPLTGSISLEEGAENWARGNAVWDAATKTIHLAAAKGEIVGFQLALVGEAAEPGVTVQIEAGDGISTKLWRTWFVNVGKRWQAEYALPLANGAALAIPAADNKIPAQKAAAVAVDLIIPESLAAGARTGKVVIKAGGQTAELAIALTIHDVVIPKEIHFNPELNCYGGPGEAGTDFFFDSFRLAHYHRSSINRVPYTQRGDVHKDWAPEVGADGRVTKWERFDKNIGPLLDGSAFKDNPRAGVPTPVLYLPLYEHFPLPFLKYYDPGIKTKGKEWKGPHDIWAKPIEESLPKEYQDAFTNCSEDFAKHFAEKGWGRTEAQCYNNNKHQYATDGPGGTAWMMDEPNETLDWKALNFYSRLFHAGVKKSGVTGINFAYRGDVSRANWQGSISDGLMELMVVPAGEAFATPYLMREHQRRVPTRMVGYGGANANDRANLESAAWCVKCYIFSCDGALPWQALGNDSAFDTGDNKDNGNALIVDGRKRFGLNAVASFRVHAFRQGAQICELLRLLEKKKGWGRAHSGMIVAQAMPLGTEFKQAFMDDAAAVTFKGLSGDQFVRLKNGILQMLAEK